MIRSPYADDWASSADALRRELAAIGAAKASASTVRQPRLTVIEADYKSLLADKVMLGNLPPHYRPLIEGGWSQAAQDAATERIAERLGIGIPKKRYDAYRFHIGRAIKERYGEGQSEQKILRGLVRDAVPAVVRMAALPQKRVAIGAGSSRRVFSHGRAGSAIRPMYDLPREALERWLLARIRDEVMASLIPDWRGLPTGGMSWRQPPRAVSKTARAFSLGQLPQLLALLTPREREVLEAGGAGRRTSYVARDLGVAESTVRVHLANIRRKARPVT